MEEPRGALEDVSASFLPPPSFHLLKIRDPQGLTSCLIHISWTRAPAILPAAQMAIKLKQSCQNLKLSASKFYILGVLEK